MSSPTHPRGSLEATMPHVISKYDPPVSAKRRPLPQSLRLVNCAVCGRELVGETDSKRLILLSGDKRNRYPPSVKGRIDSRPYCSRCYRETGNSHKGT